MAFLSSEEAAEDTTFSGQPTCCAVHSLPSTEMSGAQKKKGAEDAKVP
jgi:hypothetical protein